MLAVNRDEFILRAEIIREKGTNRSQFFRGEIDKYSWVDIGSSFLPSELVAAFLYAQLENTDVIQTRRKEIWEHYYELLKPLETNGKLALPMVPEYAANNGHMFYVVCSSLKERMDLTEFLKSKSVHAVFHYLSCTKALFMPHIMMDVNCLMLTGTAIACCAYLFL